jgi:hypothetical protein
VATVVGYQIARSSSVSRKLVTQKNSGSVFSMVASTLCTGTTLPSGTARMRTGITPAVLLDQPQPAFAVEGLAVHGHDVGGFFDIVSVTGVLQVFAQIGLQAEEQRVLKSPPRDSM